ncbi:anaphase-promoting complex subunit 13-like [Centruroides sculpturatus]|uniref:anaphase-promoting complex subunit 13-like n=2 Tax=Centruroides TaxID=6875 RepID=UPI000C6CC688|nr:anaphase-promoting complex subunit 13-like [Centruroides sculpturatus]XP_023230364.1 anaphase-promoting complex subunit 13-like [Centruroides sculpturatus]
MRNFSKRKRFEKMSIQNLIMDSDVQRQGHLIDIVDSKWREDKLPDEDIAVPALELPDPEPDNGNPQETLKEQEQKWTDLALHRIHDQSSTTTSN